MTEITPSAQFFLGANTPKGFFSKFEQLYTIDNKWQGWILKGGPGTGKSSLLKKIAKEALNRNIETELIPCSSDPNSLDAVIFPKLKRSILDGTAPHVIDPIVPGVIDKIVNLGDFWDEKILEKSKSKVIETAKENLELHKKSAAFMRAYGNITSYTDDIISKSILREKLEKFAEKKAKKFFDKSMKKQGKEIHRFFSSVTPDGYLKFKENLPKLAKEIYILTDEFGIAGSEILKILRKKALSSGYEIITCFSPFDPNFRLEALFAPEIEIAFAVLNKKEISDLPFQFKRIPTKKFLCKNILNTNKNILRFNEKVSCEFLQEAITALNDARKVHDTLEKSYIKSMDYTKVNKLTEKIIKEILG